MVCYSHIANKIIIYLFGLYPLKIYLWVNKTRAMSNKPYIQKNDSVMYRDKLKKILKEELYISDFNGEQNIIGHDEAINSICHLTPETQRVNVGDINKLEATIIEWVKIETGYGLHSDELNEFISMLSKLSTTQPTKVDEGWVSVEDRLPETECLATDGHEVLIGHITRRNSENYSAVSDDETLYNITHWMPLPEPPQSHH